MSESEEQEKRNQVRSSPLGWQLLGTAVIVVLLVVCVLALRAHAKSDTPTSESGNALNPNQLLVSSAAKEAVDLKTEKVTVETPAHFVQTNGVVHFAPSDTINVSPRLVGKISAVYVEVGEHVKEGQPLAQMISSDAANAIATARDVDEQLKLTDVFLVTARKQFSMGTPEITAAEATLIQAQENTALNKRLLELTREQNGIGGFTDKPLTDAQSAARQAETQLSQDIKDRDLAQKIYDRTAKLLKIGVETQQDVETAEDTLGKAKDAVANDQVQMDITHVTLAREQKAFDTKLYANQTVRQAESNYQQAVIQERAAGTAVRMVKAALYHDLKQAEHDYISARDQAQAAHTVLSTYDKPSAEGAIVLRSPANGVITARNVNPGQIVDQSGATPWQMFTIINATRVYVDAQVYEKDMLGIHPGQRVTATSDVLPAHFLAVGKIDYVAPGLDGTTHALSVRADVDNASGLLKDGMFVATQINLGSTPATASRPVVPLTAVVHDGDNDYVYVVGENNKYDRRQVTLGEQRGEGRVVITKGLLGNETIVTHGALYLGAGGTTQN